MMGGKVVFDQSYAIPEKVLMQDLDGETVLLNLDNGHYYGLDEIGSTVWKQMMEGKSVEECIPLLLTEYEVDEAVLRTDLSSLLNDLCEQGLVSVEMAA
jgi:hypothetical protein